MQCSANRRAERVLIDILLTAVFETYATNRPSRAFSCYVESIHQCRYDSSQITQIQKLAAPEVTMFEFLYCRPTDDR